MMNRRWTVKNRARILIVIAVLATSLFSATTVMAGDEGPSRNPFQNWVIQGEVLGAGTKFILLASERGEVPILTGEMTTFRLPGGEPGSIEDIDAGDRIVVVGRRVGPIVGARLVVTLDPGVELAGVGGQVNSIDEGRISVNSQSGEVVVLITDDDTLAFKPGTGEVSPDDIQVGDVIVAAGVWLEDESLQAFILLLPDELQRVVRVTGEVEDVDDSALTLSTGEGREVLLQVDDETTFHSLAEEKMLQDLHVGQKVTATAEVRESTLYATRLLVWPEDPTRIHGQVTAVGDGVLWLDTRRGEVEVLVGDSTIVHVPGVEEPTLQDVNAGDSVTCVGAMETDLSLNALLIAVGRGP
jgi:hypothetical protein